MTYDPHYTACAFALGRGEYCTGDVRFPETHSTRCPYYTNTKIKEIVP
jgi:hypothetical protein